MSNQEGAQRRQAARVMVAERWSESLPYLKLTDVIVPVEALWAPVCDQVFRMYVWANGRAQETGRAPNPRELAEAFAGARVYRRDAVRIFQAALVRTGLDIVTGPVPYGRRAPERAR